jgi:hypothetical protein
MKSPRHERRRDPWIEAYGHFIVREHQRLGGGPISGHYLERLRSAYREFGQLESQRPVLKRGSLFVVLVNGWHNWRQQHERNRLCRAACVAPTGAIL